MEQKQLKVDAIKHGTVIDHIPAGKAITIVDLLGLQHPEHVVMIGLNLSSRKTGKKDIIKIERRQLSIEEINSIALIAPDATVVAIDDYDVTRKYTIEAPKAIEDTLICPNQGCVTNIEKIPTKFEMVERRPIKVRCKYCEKSYEMNEIKFNF